MLENWFRSYSSSPLWQSSKEASRSKGRVGGIYGVLAGSLNKRRETRRSVIGGRFEMWKLVRYKTIDLCRWREILSLNIAENGDHRPRNSDILLLYVEHHGCEVDVVTDDSSVCGARGRGGGSGNRWTRNPFPVRVLSRRMIQALKKVTADSAEMILCLLFPPW